MKVCWVTDQVVKRQINLIWEASFRKPTIFHNTQMSSSLAEINIWRGGEVDTYGPEKNKKYQWYFLSPNSVRKEALLSSPYGVTINARNLRQVS